MAWTHQDRQFPELGKNRAKLLMAEIIYKDRKPELVNQGVISDDGRCTCFQIYKDNTEPGTGFAFRIMDSEEGAADLEGFKSYNESTSCLYLTYFH